MNDRGGSPIRHPNSPPQYPQLPYLQLEKNNSSPVGRPFLREGHNCWKVDKCKRLSFLIDGNQYFPAFMKAASAAKSSLIIQSWDLDGRAFLHFSNHQQSINGKNGPNGRKPNLRNFLHGLLERSPELQIFILVWKFSPFLTLEREHMPTVKWKLNWKFLWPPHRIRQSPLTRMHFSFERHSSVFASHHSKLTIIDNKVGFSGGMDLTRERWDDSNHRLTHSQRRDFNNIPYAPIHDVQIILEGPIIRHLSLWLNERWKRGHSQEFLLPKFLQEPKGPPVHKAHSSPTGEMNKEKSPWPEDLTSDIENIAVGMARTYSAPPRGDRANDIKEIFQFYLDAIASAKHTIYIENQYFTCMELANALSKRLQEPQGPEVVIILPYSYPGVFEKTVYLGQRNQIMAKLRRSDIYKRLKIYYPSIPGESGRLFMHLHSKIIVVDHCIMNIGSANLNNRSMFVDSECDIIIAADEEGKRGQRIAENITRFRNTLLAEHLNMPLDRFEEILLNQGHPALISAIWAALTTDAAPDREKRTLKELQPHQLSKIDRFFFHLLGPFVDPRTPMSFFSVLLQLKDPWRLSFLLAVFLLLLPITFLVSHFLELGWDFQ